MSQIFKSGIILISALLSLNCYATPLGMPVTALHPGIQSPTINNPGGKTAGQAQANYDHNNDHNNNHNNNHGHNNGNNYPHHNHNGNYYHSYNHHYPQNNVVVYPFVYSVVNDGGGDAEVTPTPVSQDQPQGQPLQPNQQTPDGVWVNAINGQVPPNAIAEQDSTEENNNANNVSYYCRAIYNEQIFYGELVPGDGCYVEDSAHQATIRLKDYQALVGN
jgi:hypothetical protein